MDIGVLRKELETNKETLNKQLVTIEQERASLKSIVDNEIAKRQAMEKERDSKQRDNEELHTKNVSEIVHYQTLLSALEVRTIERESNLTKNIHTLEEEMEK